MKADNPEQYNRIRDAFLSAVAKVKADETCSLSDMYVCCRHDESLLCIYDDMEQLLSQTALYDGEPFKEDFEEETVTLLKEVLNSDPVKRELEALEFIGPFSVVLVDESYEQICELVTVDKENILLEDDFFSKIDKDLDDFFEKLMADVE